MGDGRCYTPLPDWPESLTLTTLEHQNPRPPPISPFLLLFSRFPSGTYRGHLGLPYHQYSSSPSSIHQIRSSLLAQFAFAFFSVSVVLVQSLPHHTTSLPPSMSSITSTNHHHPARHQTSTIPMKKCKMSNSSRKVLLHHPMTSSPPDDWVLFPQEIIKEKHSSIRDDHAGRLASSGSSSRRSSPISRHVTKSKATVPARLEGRQPPKPYKPSTCSKHMSARNCTAACIDAKSPAVMSKPPKAPSPPRLLTPDLSDVEEDDLWSCCMSSESNESSQCAQEGGDFWSEMGK